MKKMKSKLLNLCYFKKLDMNEQNELLGEFEAETERTSESEAYEKCKDHVLVSFKNDSYKVYLFILSCVIIFCSLMAPIFFVTNAALWYGIFTYLNCALYAIYLVSLICGICIKKIKIRAYKYHGMLLAAQLIISCAGTIFVFYKLAESLSTF